MVVKKATIVHRARRELQRRRLEGKYGASISPHARAQDPKGLMALIYTPWAVTGTAHAIAQSKYL